MGKLTRKKVFRRTLRVLLVLFVLMNIVAAMHAYKFTHFSQAGLRNEQLKLDAGTKVRLLLTGVDNPYPVNKTIPDMPYEVVHIKSNVDLEGWLMPAVGIAKGTVILFHGYTSCKSMVLPRAYPLLKAGYNCLLVDFMGSGGSGGNSTTIGYREAMEVADCYNYMDAKGEKKIYLLGSSMGAVAIMKALDDYKLGPKGVILECPFATMKETVEGRFRMLHVPSFPMASLLLFWGGVENGFWPYGHNPVDYAKNIKCPVLLQYGVHDDRVTRGEIDRIYYNLPGTTELAIYPDAGHDDYLAKSPAEWTKNVTGFLEGN